MVVEDAAEDAEPRQIVFEGVVGPVPGCDIEGSVLLLAGVKTASKFGDDGP